MNYNDFMRALEKDDLGPVYLFVGEEEYLMTRAFAALKDKYIDESFESINFVKIDERYGDLDAVKNACETLPFMANKKLVLLKDIGRFLENQNGNFDKEFYSYLDSLGDHLCFILMDNTLNIKKTSKIYKYFKKRGTAVSFDKLKGPQLSQWVLETLKIRGKTISPANINYFIQQSSYLSRNININLYMLENFLLKVVDLAGGQEITKADLDLVLVKSIDTNIFELLNAINRFDTEAALRELNQMYMANEPIPRIIFMIIRRIRLILSHKLYLEKGYMPRQIQDKLGIKDYEFKIISGQARNFKSQDLEEMMRQLLEMDIKIKTTSIDEKLLVEMFLIELCSKNK